MSRCKHIYITQQCLVIQILPVSGRRECQDLQNWRGVLCMKILQEKFRELLTFPEQEGFYYTLNCFPIATVTKYHKLSGFKKKKNTDRPSYGPADRMSKMNFLGQNQSVGKAMLLSGRSRKEFSFFGHFLLLEGPPHPSILKWHHSNVCFCHHISSF